MFLTVEPLKSKHDFYYIFPHSLQATLPSLQSYRVLGLGTFPSTAKAPEGERSKAQHPPGLGRCSHWALITWTSSALKGHSSSGEETEHPAARQRAKLVAGLWAGGWAGAGAPQSPACHCLVWEATRQLLSSKEPEI